MPKLQVVPIIDGTMVRLIAPDGTQTDFASPLKLWHAIVAQAGFFGPKSLGLCPAELHPDRVRSEHVRINDTLARCERNRRSLPAPAARMAKPSTPSTRKPPAPLLDPETATL